MTIKSRKQGTSIVLTVPIEFSIKENELFEPRQLANGTIEFVPVQIEFPEIWNDNPNDIAKFNSEIGLQDDKANFGRENVEY